MKIANRYEVLEAVTTGAVDVFVAHDQDAKLRRLVFFLAADNVASPPSTREILERFRTRAPDPPGVILDVGLDQAGARFYLVTSFPSDPLAMRDWVQAYRSFSTTGGPPSSKMNAARPPSSGFAGEGDPAPPLEEPQRDIPPGPIETAKNSDAGNPGEFTRMFRPSRQLAATSSEISDPGPGSGGFRKEVSSPSMSVNASFEPASFEPAPEGGAGEFTKFFRGSLNSQPVRLPLLDEPTPKTGSGPGEFTRVFGSPSTPPTPANSGLGDDLFPSGPIEQAPSAAMPATSFPPRPNGLRSDAGSGAPDFSRPLSFEGGEKAGTNLIARPGEPASQIPEPIWDRSQVSSSKAGTGPPRPSILPASPEPARAGPSEYTRIVSGGLRNRTAEREPPALQPAAPPLESPVPAPSVPPTPSPAPAPAAPQLSAAPRAAPALPVEPKSKLALYWPLVVIFNGLLVAAIALVIYFALKPR